MMCVHHDNNRVIISNSLSTQFIILLIGLQTLCCSVASVSQSVLTADSAWSGLFISQWTCREEQNLHSICSPQLESFVQTWLKRLWRVADINDHSK